MITIVILGRGGQGGITAARILGSAVLVENPAMNAVQDLPQYGTERRGALTTATVRIDFENPQQLIRNKSQPKDVDFLVILDSKLTEEGKAFVNPQKTKSVLINTAEQAEGFACFGVPVAVVDGYKIARLKALGENVNTALLGAFAKISGLVRLESILSAIEEKIGKKAKHNKKAAMLGFEQVIF